MSWQLSMERIFIASAQYEGGLACSLGSGKELAVPNPEPECPECILC